MVSSSFPSASPSARAHFVVSTIPVHSHITPMVGTCMTLLMRFPRLIVTLCVASGVAAHAHSEIQVHTCDLDGAADILKRFRVYVIPDAPPAEGSTIVEILEKSSETFGHTLRALLNAEDVTDDAGKVLSSVPPPSLLISDYNAWYSAPAARFASKDLRVLSYCVSPAGYASYFFGPIPGTWGTFPDRALVGLADESFRRGRTEEATKEELILTELNEEIVRIPGYPGVYGYEIHPQKDLFDGFAAVVSNSQKLLNSSDGLMVISSPFVEPETIPFLRTFAPNGVAIPILPRIPPIISGFPEGDSESLATQDRKRILAFLDGKRPNSVLYISFGSAWHPFSASPVNFAALVETLLEDDQPWSFIMTKGTRYLDTLPQNLVERVEKSDKGLYVDWAPQREVLSHTAVGLMLSHAGTGGVFEALTSNVPILSWPLLADQPAMAQIIAAHGAGLELFQVRTGRGARDSLVLGKFVGTVDAVKTEIREKLTRLNGDSEEAVGFRTKAMEFGQKLVTTRLPGGESYEALSAFEQYM